MAKKLSFDAYLGWVNITNPNQIPEDARVIGANDLLRYEKLGKDTAEKFAELDATVEGWKSDTIISDLIVEETSETRYAVGNMVKTAVTDGVAKFQKVIDEVPAKVEAQVAPMVAKAIAADGSVAAAATAAVNGVVQDLDLVMTTDQGILRPSVHTVQVPTYNGPATNLDTAALTKRVVTEGTTRGTRWFPRLLLGEALVRPLASLHGYLSGTILGGKWAEDVLQHDGNVPDWVLLRWKQRGQFGVPDSTVQPLDIVIIAGQSNATKRGSVVSDQEPDLPGVLLWNGDNAAVGDKWDASKGVPWLGSGFGLSWLRHEAGWKSRRVGLVRACRGSTGFSSLSPATWDRTVTTGADRYLYPEMISRAKAALAGSPAGSRIIAVVWSQGEQDRQMAPATYEAKLDDLIKQTRIDLGISDLPFIITSMTPETLAPGNSAGGQLISSVLEDTTRRLHRTAFHQGPANMSEAASGIHWTPQGQSQRGAQMAVTSLQQARENLPTSMAQSPHSFKIRRSGNSALITWEHPFSRVTSYTIETSTNEGTTWTALNLGSRIVHRAELSVPSNLPLWVRGTAHNETGTSMTSLAEKG